MTSLPLTCPCVRKCKLVSSHNGLLCSDDQCCHSNEDMQFPIVDGTPILISEVVTDTVFDRRDDVIYVERKLAKLDGLRNVIVGRSPTTIANCSKFISEVKALSKKPKILVIGSGERGSGTEELWGDDQLEIHGVDVYRSPTVDVVCDGHYLPLANQTFDGVWIQAVLEHVVEPQKVVSQIHRILKSGGIVYAETPFMQQVHEGAYDFTRFTVLGHRYLFKNFDAIDFGGNKGPEVVFAWACRYLTWSITRSRKISRIVGLGVGLIVRPLTYLISKKSMFDASSGVYFFGRRREDHTVSHKELVSLYKGQF